MPEQPAHQLLLDIEARLRSGVNPVDWPAVLDRILDHFGGQTGTIHRLDPAAGLLSLVVHRGLPEGLLPRVTSIPIGKGMAGIAAERREPVQVCNLQTDESGLAQPAARQTGMQGSIAVPMLVDGELRGVLGVAKAAAHDFEQQEIDLLMKVASRIGEHFEK